MSWPSIRAKKNIGGTYKWIDGKSVKVSDSTGVFFDAYVPEGGYIDDNLGHAVQDRHGNSHWIPAEITSREQKARILREKGVVEDGGRYGQREARRSYFDVGRR